MNSYEQKQEARRERLERAAERHAEQSSLAFGRASQMGRAMDKGLAEDKRAKELARKAEAVGRGGISSDDPDAVAKLGEELAKEEALHVAMVAVNKAHKAYKKNPASLDTAPISEAMKERVRSYVPAYSWEPHPFAPYQLQNSGANIRRIKGRIEDLKKRAEAVAALPSAELQRVALSGDWWRITEDLEDNRVLIEFDRRTSKELYKQIRAHGFVWSPTRSAFVRKLNGSARMAAEGIASRLRDGAV